jgi:hypothetical protein
MAFHEWLGRAELLGDMWERWRSGDRAGAVEAVPDEVVDELVIHGHADAMHDKLRAYADSGSSTTISRGVHEAPASGLSQLPVNPVCGRPCRGHPRERAAAEALRGETAAVSALLGLRLSETKTTIAHLDEGFDFVGFRIS